MVLVLELVLPEDSEIPSLLGADASSSGDEGGRGGGEGRGEGGGGRRELTQAGVGGRRGGRFAPRLNSQSRV